MIFNKEGNSIIVVFENSSVSKCLENLTKEFQKIKGNNIILNLLSFDQFNVSNALEFLPFSKKHRSEKKSFVLVSDKVSYDDVPEELCVVPTIQEAKDLIEMEEIERDLGI